ncbi:ferredoxin [Nocardia sp. NPDC003482]
MTTPWRLHIDWTRCAARGLCAELLPHTLTRDEWGYPLTADRPDPALTPDQLPAAHDAVALCPRLALTLHPPTP